jgi:YbbR domain-containing protein
VVTKSVPVRAITTGEETLSPALAVEESPITEPAEVAVTGGAPAVERVDHAIAELPLPNAAGLVRRVVPVTPANADGLAVGDIAVEPAQVRVEAQVVQRANARDVGIRVVTSGELPAGYRLENLTSEPNRVTLIGDPDVLEQTGGVVDTIPVDLSRGVDDFSVQLPLDLPLDAEAVNDEGETVRSVLVQVDVAPRTANLVFSRTVELVGSPGLDVTMEPATVDVIVNGPVPTLNEIEAQPSLLRVLIEATALADLEPGATIPLTPTVVYPEGTRVQLIPETVSVTVEAVTMHRSQVVSRPW